MVSLHDILMSLGKINQLQNGILTCFDDVSLLRMIAKIFLISDNFAYDSVSLRSFLIVEQITSASKATALDSQTCTYTQNRSEQHRGKTQCA